MAYPSHVDFDRQLQPANDAINSIANDVEMQAPDAFYDTYMVIDTNILLHHFEGLRSFVEDVEQAQVAVVVVVPGTVIYEIDSQKNRPNLAWPARRASGWILDQLKRRKCVKVQATEETCKPSLNWRTKSDARNLLIPGEMMNDHLILDCCQFFQRKHPRTILCSADQNLCIIAQSQGIPYMTPPRTKPWTSREIAVILYEATYPLLHRFRAENIAYAKQEPTTLEESDVMMVDEEVEEIPLNVLHDDMRVYFTRLLVDAALKLGGEDLKQPNDTVGLSKHAAGWKKKHYMDWSSRECIEYLCDTRPDVRKEIESGHPRLEAFLARRYEGHGARTGTEWSAEDWRRGIAKLEKVGNRLGERGIEEAVRDLSRFLDAVLFVDTKKQSK